MELTPMRQLTLYRFRYVLGYGLYMIALALLLTVNLSNTPPGISQAEMASAVTSGNITFNLDAHLINAPYHFLQQLSINLFGLTAFSLRLPTVIFGFLSGLFLLLLLKRWFKTNVAVITALLSVSGGLFLGYGRLGTPGIMIIFWSLTLLLLGSLIVQEAKGQFGWKLLLGLSLGLMIYTPLMLPVVIAVLVAALAHPHGRYVIMRFGKVEAVSAFLLIAILWTPLLIKSWHDPVTLKFLLDLPGSLPSFKSYLSNLGNVLVSLGGFWSPQIGILPLPLFSVPTLILMLLGLLKLLADRHALRTYVILFWLVITIPVLALIPDSITIVMIPFILLLASGVYALMTEWYTLFPLNPYARLAGLLPLVALIGGVSFWNYVTYFQGYHYSPEAAKVFSVDLPLANQWLKRQNSDQSMVLVLSNQTPDIDKEFYSLLTKKHPTLQVVRESQLVKPASLKDTKFLSANSVNQLALSSSLGQPTELLVNARSTDSLRWLIYKS